MRTRTHRTLLTATAACTALLFTAAGCTEGAEPTPEPTPTTSSAAPSPTTSAWEDKFSPKQMKAYEAALTRWTEYEKRSEPIWADGKVTPAAKELFAEYWVLGAIPENKLSFYEEVGNKIIGLPDVGWSRPSKVTLRSGAASVVIEQCIDPSTIRVEHAEGADVQEKKQGSYIRRISLDRLGSKPFKITSVFDITSGKKVTPCEP